MLMLMSYFAMMMQMTIWVIKEGKDDDDDDTDNDLCCIGAGASRRAPHESL